MTQVYVARVSTVDDMCCLHEEDEKEGSSEEEVGEVEEAPEDQGGRAQLLRDVGDEGLPVLV